MIKPLFICVVLFFLLSGIVFGQSKKDTYKSLIDEITQEHKESLVKASGKIKVSILKNAKFKDDEAELRIWMIDNFETSVFIIERKNSQMKARNVVFDNQKGKMERDAFLKPKNGWESLNQYLKDKKLDFDLQMNPEEENFPIHPDALFFLIEAREGKKYSMYWYIYNTNNGDGKRVQNLCGKIKEEFDLEFFICNY